MRLVLVLLAASAALQVVLWLLARALGRRLALGVLLLGQLLPWVVLFPWIAGDALLVPTGVLAGQVPGTPRLETADRFAVLNDAVLQFLPWELEVRHRLAERRLPLWSDLLDGGSDLWSNPQAGVLSPIAALARAAPIQHHLLVALALKILVAFQGTWLLARCLGARPATALLAGVGFGLSGAIFAWALFPHSAVAAWTPWLAAGAARLARAPRTRAVVLAATAVAAAAVFLSGQPEAAAAAALLAAVVALAVRRRREPWPRPLARVAAAGILGAGLAALHLVPFALLLSQSQRAGEHLVAEAAPGDPRLWSPRTWFNASKGGFFLAPASPLAFGMPYRESFRGPIAWAVAETSYAGVVTFLGLVAALGGACRRRALPLVAFAGAVLLLAAELLPLERLLHALPPLRLPEYTRFLPAAVLGLVVAGALAIEELPRLGARRRWGAFSLAAAASLLLAPRPWVALLWALVGAALMISGGRRRLALGVLAAVALLDLGRWGRWLLPVGDAAHFYPSTECTALLQRETAGAPWRAVGQRFLAYPSILPVYRVAEVRPHNPLALMDQVRVLDAAFGYGPDTAQYFAPFDNLDHPLLDFLNVRAVVSNAFLPEPSGLQVAPGGERRNCRVYRNPQALPRWFLPRQVDAVERDRMPAWMAELDDPWRVAVWRDEVPGPPRPVAASGAGEVRLLEGGPGRLRLQIPGGEETLLATSVPGPRGWRATAGGQRLRTLTVNGAFLGVLLPAGGGEVELRYRPPGLAAGAALSALAGLALAALLLAPAAGRRAASRGWGAWRSGRGRGRR